MHARIEKNGGWEVKTEGWIMTSQRQSDALPLNLLALFCLWRRFARSYCCQQSLFSVDGIKEHSATEFSFAMRQAAMKEG